MARREPGEYALSCDGPPIQALGRPPNAPWIVEPTRFGYGVMVNWLSTLVTPGADSAACLAAEASLQELTCPCSVTWPSSVVSQMRRASIWAWRCRASLIFDLTSL
jgi:hypothetical protein